MTTTAPPQPKPDPSRRTRRSLRRTITTAAVCGVTVGAVATVSWATRSDGTNEATVTETITTLEVDVASGDVEIIGTDRDDVEIQWRERSSMFGDATLTHQVTGSTLRVVGTCDSTLWFGNCSTDVVIRVPDGVDVVATATGGDLTVAGLAGTADLRSTTGDVRAEDQDGDIVARSTAGDVTIDDLWSGTAAATSEAGDVIVIAAEPPTSVEAESTAGDVHVTVPADEAYDVETQATAGDTTVEVRTDPASQRVIRAASTAGDVVVDRP